MERWIVKGHVEDPEGGRAGGDAMEEEQVDKAGKEVLKERVDDMLEKTADQIDQSTQIIFHKKNWCLSKQDGWSGNKKD